MKASWYREHRRPVWGLVILLPVLILILGCLIAPEIFWDGFVYKYFWGPIVSDLEGRPVEGIAEGYNIVNTIVYALLLAGALYVLYRLFRRLRVAMDLGLILASLPIFIFGGVSRALEDASLFQGWTGYLFISPLIYFMIATMFGVAGAVGYLIRRRELDIREQLVVFSVFITVLLVIYYVFTVLWGEDLSYVLPFYLPPVVAVGVIGLFYMLISRGYDTLRVSILCTGTMALLIACLYASAFAFSEQWQAIYTSIEGKVPELRPMEAIIIPGIALALSAVIYVMGRAWPKLAFLALPTSFLMFLAHFLDGAATFRGIDLYGYGEKHVLPTALIELFDTAAVMLLLKFVLILAIILMIDVLFKKDLEEYPGLGNIMKFAVIFLGIAPGIRDLVRITLGV
jgi:uncharacterized membrane protein